MIVLALDTATESCSVSVMRGEELLLELNDFSGKTHAKHVMQMIHFALKMAGLSVSEVNGYVVTLGPGSFTGLRIGLSTIKGLAGAGEKKVVGVSTLYTLLKQAPLTSPLVCPLIDARRSEVYYAIYRNNRGDLSSVGDDGVGSIDRLMEKVDQPCLFIGSGALRYKDRIQGCLGELALFVGEDLNFPRAGVLAREGMAKLMKGESDDVDHLTPYYIRKSDAQIQQAG